MKLSTKGKYGVYAMHYLAEHRDEGLLSLRSMADIGVPEVYLEQLLGVLRRGGLVNAVRGASGGYQLARDPSEITVGEIINITEGPILVSDCIVDEGCCDRCDRCASRVVWDELTCAINNTLNAITLQDMLDRQHDKLEKKNQA